MPFIITDPCIGTKDTACVDVCPVDCIHPRKDEPEFAQATILYPHRRAADPDGHPARGTAGGPRRPLKPRTEIRSHRV